jgi:hypothetical protein
VEFEVVADGSEVVKAIDGIATDENRRWELFVNGFLSEQTASQYITTETDIIEWRLVDN